MSTEDFFNILCLVISGVAFLSAAVAVHFIVKYWDSAAIRNRQPFTYLAWVLMITTRNVLLSIISQMESWSAFEFFLIWVAFLVSEFLAKVLFFHRISIFVYSCFVQNWLCDLDMWDFQDVQSLRSSLSLSSIAWTDRRTIPKIMLVALVIMSLFAFVIWIWNMYDVIKDNIGIIGP